MEKQEQEQEHDHEQEHEHEHEQEHRTEPRATRRKSSAPAEALTCGGSLQRTMC